VLLPADIWLLLPPLLIQADIQALAGVCVTLRKIFGPLVKFRVTIMRNSSLSYTLHKAVAITRTSTIRDRVVEINIGTLGSTHTDSRRAFNVPHLLSPAIFPLVNAIPGMQRLQTIHLAHVILSRTYLYTILSSPYLIHLILDAVQMPKASRFPPPNLRKLTLTLMASWEAVQPLMTHLATSLEYLELQGCEFHSLRQLQLPSFPCLRELRHHQGTRRNTFPDDSKLNELFCMGSRVAHIHLSGTFHHTRVITFPKSLQHLSITEPVLRQLIVATDPLPQLLSLSIQCFPGWWGLNDRPELPSVLSNHFPKVISLNLDIMWSLRNFALVLARSQRNLQVLKLHIHEMWSLGTITRFPAEIPDDSLREFTLSAPLQTLKVEVVQAMDGLERSVAPFVQWIGENVLPSVTGLGGPDLKSIDVSFVQPENLLVREQVLCRQWVKSSNGDWQIVG
jgi:hypothetical protein